jgi:hypothetical protein
LIRGKESDVSSKRLRPDETPVDLPDDLDQNPGIGQSKCFFARTDGRDSELIGVRT